MKKHFIRILAMAGIVALVVGCGGIGGMPGSQGMGKLIVSPDGSGIKGNQLTPPIHMTPTNYDLELRNSANTVIKSENITGTVVYSGLVAGVYTVNLTAKNDTGDSIGFGTNTVNVIGGDTVTCTVPVKETSGDGGLSVLADWPAGSVADPRVVSTLGFGSATGDPINWSVSANSATYASGMTLPNGWYAMTMQLFTGIAITPSAGFATLARIAAGQTTTGTVHLVPNATGSFQVLITLDFFDPITLGTSVPEGAVNIFSGSPASINVTGAGLITWYVDGVAQTAGSSFNLDPAVFTLNSMHRVDCLGFSGKNAGQLSWNVSNYDPAKAVMGTLGHHTTGGDAIVRIAGGSVTKYFVVHPLNGVYSYQFLGLPSNTYTLAMGATGVWLDGEGQFWYWNSAGNGDFHSGTAESIVIPNPAGTVYTCNW